MHYYWSKFKSIVYGVNYELISLPSYTGWLFIAFQFMLCSPAHQNLHALTWKHKSLFHTTEGVQTGDLVVPAFLFYLSYPLIHIFISEHDCTPLQCFYKGCIQSNQQMALSQLMHSIHCSSAVFPYQAHDRRPAQETFIGCAGLHSIKNLKVLDIQSVYNRHSSCVLISWLSFPRYISLL
jgi:hypothetical protein